MNTLENLLLIAGTGTKSGKTSFACKVIDQFKSLNVYSIKITPHFHETTDGLILISENDGYTIFEETNSETDKDTSRMLNAGAFKVYFAKVWDNKLAEAFSAIMKIIPPKVPVICESPALRNFLQPGVFIIMTSNVIHKHKDIKHLQALPHIILKYEDLDDINTLPLIFENGKWSYLKSGPKSEVRSPKSED